MPRFLIAAFGAAVLGSACKVERTPSEYFDHRAWSEADVEATASELQDRVLATGQAIARGSATEALLALAPDADARVVAPGSPDGIAGPVEIQAALRRFADSGIRVRLTLVRVTVNQRGDAAWFVADGVMQGEEGEDDIPLVVTGTYLKSEGAWEMVQAHISTPEAEPGVTEENPREPE